MSGLQRAGGVAALVEAATFVFGFWVLSTLLAPAGYLDAGADPVRNAALLAENEAVMYVWHMVIYVMFGVFLVVLALALHERLKVGSPAVARTAAAFGLVWAGLVIASGMVANVGMGAVVELYGEDPDRAASLWLAVNSVVVGLGGGNEIVGSLWVLLASLAALRAGELPKALNYSGSLVGAAGLLTVIPALEVFGAVFGLGLIVWFVWLGVVMLRGGQTKQRKKPM